MDNKQLEQLKKIAEKGLTLEKTGVLGMAKEFIAIEDNISSVKDSISDIADGLKKKLEEELSYEVDESKIVESVLAKVEIPEPVKGEKGDTYKLTEKDKKEIANSIKVPVVEKIIEKTEIIHETPIITNEIKEVAVSDTPEETIQKLNSLPVNEDRLKLDFSHIKGFKKIENYFGGSGIKEIIAGTGITVDNTNLGYPVISSTGGGSGSQTPWIQDIDARGWSIIQLGGLIDVISGYKAILDTSGLTTDQNFLFPDNSGTLALFSDIPTGLADVLLLGNSTGGTAIDIQGNQLQADLMNNIMFGAGTGYGFSDTVAMGHNALHSQAGAGFGNVALGYNALQATGGTSYNAAFGFNALYSLSTGDGNLAFGANAFYNLSSSADSIAIGSNAGTWQTGGNKNVIIGTSIDFLNTVGSNQLNLVNAIYGVDMDGTGTINSSGAIGFFKQAPLGKVHIGSGGGGAAPFVIDSGGAVNIAGAINNDGTRLYYSDDLINLQTLAFLSDLSTGYVPYTGATADLDMGAYNLFSNGITIGNFSGVPLFDVNSFVQIVQIGDYLYGGGYITVDAGSLTASTNLDWDFNNNLLHNVTDPVSAQDVATKNYVDSTSGSGLSQQQVMARLSVGF